MLALSYHLTGVIACCVLQNRGKMNTMWNSINHMCQSGETQWIPLCQQPHSVCAWGRQSPFITGTSWRLPVTRHRPDQFCRPELMFQYGILKGEPQDCIYLLCLLHCSGHNSVLVEVHKITPPFLFCLKLRSLTLLSVIMTLISWRECFFMGLVELPAPSSYSLFLWPRLGHYSIG